jgi:hypothetical protein
VLGNEVLAFARGVLARGLERHERVGAETSDQPLAIDREALRTAP